MTTPIGAVDDEKEFGAALSSWSEATSKLEEMTGTAALTKQESSKPRSACTIYIVMGIGCLVVLVVLFMLVS